MRYRIYIAFSLSYKILHTISYTHIKLSRFVRPFHSVLACWKNLRVSFLHKCYVCATIRYRFFNYKVLLYSRSIRRKSYEIIHILRLFRKFFIYFCIRHLRFYARGMNLLLIIYAQYVFLFITKYFFLWFIFIFYYYIIY